jgi:hypothetical protein
VLGLPMFDLVGSKEELVIGPRNINVAIFNMRSGGKIYLLLDMRYARTDFIMELGLCVTQDRT